MDTIDVKLLQLFAQEADATTSSLVPRLNLSVPAINKRIARLKAGRVIERVTILTDPQKVGKPVTAFVLIVLDHFKQSEKLLETAAADPDILECYAVTGEYDYLLKICARDIDALEDKLLKLKEKGIAKSQTMFALRKHKFAPTALPDAPQ